MAAKSRFRVSKVKYLKGNGSKEYEGANVIFAVDDPYPRVSLGQLDRGGFIVRWSYSFNDSRDQSQQFFTNRQDAEAKYGELTKEVGSQLAMQF